MQIFNIALGEPVKFLNQCCYQINGEVPTDHYVVSCPPLSGLPPAPREAINPSYLGHLIGHHGYPVIVFTSN